MPQSNNSPDRMKIFNHLKKGIASARSAS